jgi:hypothetical protein
VKGDVVAMMVIIMMIVIQWIWVDDLHLGIGRSVAVNAAATKLYFRDIADKEVVPRMVTFPTSFLSATTDQRLVYSRYNTTTP